jgi:chemotaxis protein methyltransferase CheR
MVTRGESGRYPLTRLADILAAYRDGVVRDANGFGFTPQVRGLVRFRELNLIGDWPLRGRFDLIFCRNVMIYFDDQTQNRIWGRFAQSLQPGGTLCIGHSERVDTEQHPFSLVGQTVYSRRAA